MVGSTPNSKAISYPVGKDQGVFDVRNTKKTLKTSPINYQSINLKKKFLFQGPLRKRVRKDGICLKEGTQDNEARQRKNRKGTQLQVQRLREEKLYRKYQEPSPLIL